jgi:hypothetical protein
MLTSKTPGSGGCDQHAKDDNYDKPYETLGKYCARSTRSMNEKAMRDFFDWGSQGSKSG